MRKTEKKYWENGFERKGTFWNLSISIGSIGLLICKPFYNNPIFNFYWLVK